MAKPVENKAKKLSNMRIYCVCGILWRIGSVIGSVKQKTAHPARGKMGWMLDFIGFVDLIGYGIDRLFYSGLHVGNMVRQCRISSYSLYISLFFILLKMPINQNWLQLSVSICPLDVRKEVRDVSSEYMASLLKLIVNLFCVVGWLLFREALIFLKCLAL